MWRAFRGDDTPAPLVQNLERELRDARARASRADEARASARAESEKLRRTCAALQSSIQALEGEHVQEREKLAGHCESLFQRCQRLEEELDQIAAGLDDEDETQGLTNPVMAAATIALPIEPLPDSALHQSFVDAPTQFDLMLQSFVRPLADTRSDRRAPDQRNITTDRVVAAPLANCA